MQSSVEYWPQWFVCRVRSVLSLSCGSVSCHISLTGTAICLTAVPNCSALSEPNWGTTCSDHCMCALCEYSTTTGTSCATHLYITHTDLPTTEWLLDNIINSFITHLLLIETLGHFIIHYTDYEFQGGFMQKKIQYININLIILNCKWRLTTHEHLKLKKILEKNRFKKNINLDNLFTKKFVKALI